VIGGVAGGRRVTGRGVEVGQRGNIIVGAGVVAGQPGSAVHGGSWAPCERGRCV
jgi:hypothetical protein